jgi:hypothetical protein
LKEINNIKERQMIATDYQTSLSGNLQSLPIEEDKLSSKDLLRKITRLIHAQIQYLTDIHEDNAATFHKLRRLKTRTSRGLGLSEKNVIDILKYSYCNVRVAYFDKKIYGCWQNYQRLLLPHKRDINSLTALDTKIQEDLRSNVQKGFEVSVTNPPLIVLEKERVNAKCEFPHLGISVVKYYPINDLEAFKKFSDLWARYMRDIDVELDTTLPIYQFKLPDEEINEKNTNLKFDQNKLNRIPEPHRQVLLQYIKPFMFTPSNTQVCMIYGKHEEEQKKYYLKRSVGVYNFFQEDQNQGDQNHEDQIQGDQNSENHIVTLSSRTNNKVIYNQLSPNPRGIVLIEQFTDASDEMVLPHLVAKQLNKETKEHSAKETEKLSQLSHLIQTYIRTLEKEKSLILTQKMKEETSHTAPANLSEGRSENCKKEIMQQIAAQQQKRRRARSSNKTKHFANCKEKECSKAIPRLFTLSDSRSYEHGLIILGLTKQKINWRDAIACAAKLNFKVEPMGGSIFKFTLEDHIDYMETESIGQRIETIWKECNKTSKNIHMPHGKKSSEYLSKRRTARFKRMFEKVGITRETLRFDDKTSGILQEKGKSTV